MQFIPTEQEVIDLLRRTGALRQGHFIYPNGIHSSEYLQAALAMRDYHNAKILSVALSRKVRSNPEIRAIVPQLSIVTVATGGLPVAYGMCEALRARQVYWAERPPAGGTLRFRQFIEPEAGEKVLVVDDLVRTGKRMCELIELLNHSNVEIVGVAAVLYQPGPEPVDFSPLPFYYLAKLQLSYYRDPSECLLCKDGVPAVQIWV